MMTPHLVEIQPLLQLLLRLCGEGATQSLFLETTQVWHAPSGRLSLEERAHMLKYACNSACLLSLQGKAEMETCANGAVVPC